MAEHSNEYLAEVVSQFDISGNLEEIVPYGTGHINDTYASKIKTGNGIIRFIHQRMNHTIFKEPERLMRNIERVTAHLREKVLSAGGNPQRNVLTIVPTTSGQSFIHDNRGNYWRTYVFIEGARTYDIIENLDHITNASRAFGEFQKHLADLPGKRLHETIPDFHDTKKRFDTFIRTLEKDPVNRAADVRSEIDFATNRQKDTEIIVNLMNTEKIPERITHNDTKFNNIMIDDQTGKGVCVIDLDTVMPGSVLYDFGDSVRIGASTAAEDERDLSKVSISLDMFDRLARGYLESAGAFLAPEEIRHLAFSAKLLTLECGIRFLTDHLDGDNYFKVHRENHNLDRCRTQFKMVADMEKKMEEMMRIIETYS